MNEPKCESCGTPWAEHPGMMALCAELQALRKLCAERPKLTVADRGSLPVVFLRWSDKIDDAGRVEGTE